MRLPANTPPKLEGPETTLILRKASRAAAPLLLLFLASLGVAWRWRVPITQLRLGGLETLDCLPLSRWPAHWFTPVCITTALLVCWPVFASMNARWLSSRVRWPLAVAIGALAFVSEACALRLGHPFFLTLPWRPCEEVTAMLLLWLHSSLQPVLLLPPIVHALALATLKVGSWRNTKSRWTYAFTFLIAPQLVSYFVLHQVDLISMVLFSAVYAVIDRIGKWRAVREPLLHARPEFGPIEPNSGTRE